jgi:type IV pilus assembly protein PilV
VCHFRIQNNSQGFTLIEALIAIVLLSVSILGLSAMTIGTIKGLVFSNNRTIATTLARDRLEQIKHAGYATAPSEPYPLEHDDTLVGYKQFQRHVTIQNNPPPRQNTRTVAVIVRWQDSAGSPREVVLRTVMAP